MTKPKQSLPLFETDLPLYKDPEFHSYIDFALRKWSWNNISDIATGCECSIFEFGYWHRMLFGNESFLFPYKWRRCDPGEWNLFVELLPDEEKVRSEWMAGVRAAMKERARMRILEYLDAVANYIAQGGNYDNAFCVYLLSAAFPEGRHKIGATKHLKIRLGTLRSKSKAALSLEHTINVPDYFGLEARIQWVVKEKRVPQTKDWFDLSIEDVAWIKSLKVPEIKESIITAGALTEPQFSCLCKEDEDFGWWV